ncbi:uncharacterized protein DUF1828 [Kribbella steppae]|uniref:Uncharacterized protein DUF1828 n=1 Tax=Kribbella steppae TaxID=2512223 RepID=A0A4R2HUJ1_9ACTN|nr:DUF1828 domain-containing protein [Kribbella steppae]TCO34709.1 uncharacterized protein DUF1828 [Kribbella steppae]
MTTCKDLAPVISALTERYGWTCRPVPNRSDVLELGTGRVWPDSEPLRILVRVDEENNVFASDGGVTMLRLRDGGFDADDSLLPSLWNLALEEYGLSEVDDRLYVEAEMQLAADAVNHLADAMLAIDGLRLVAVPKQARGRALSDEVEDYLRTVNAVVKVRRKPTIRFPGGLVVRPTLSIDTVDRRQVLVQTGARTSRGQAYDHVFTTFGLVHGAEVPMDHRLAVLSGSVQSWQQSRIWALAQFTYVGFWDHRETLRDFFAGPSRSQDRILVPEGIEIPLIT